MLQCTMTIICIKTVESMGIGDPNIAMHKPLAKRLLTAPFDFHLADALA